MTNTNIRYGYEDKEGDKDNGVPWLTNMTLCPLGRLVYSAVNRIGKEDINIMTNDITREG